MALLAGPTVAFGEDEAPHGKEAEQHGAEVEHGEGADRDETYFLVRLGVGYDFHLGEKFGLAPQVNLDFVNNEEVWVYGVALTYGF